MPTTSYEEFCTLGAGGKFLSTVSRETYVSWESLVKRGPTLTPNFSFDMERRRKGSPKGSLCFLVPFFVLESSPDVLDSAVSWYPQRFQPRS